jgi:hypothetical protein
MKWLAVAAAAVAAALLVLWYQVRSPASPAAAAPAAAPTAAVPRSPNLGTQVQAPGHLPDGEPLPEDVWPAGTLAPGDETGPIKKFSDAFWERIDETYSRRLLGYAADCYSGGKQRKQKLKLAFRFDISGGQVSVRDVRVVESTLGDAALESCMAAAVAKATFEDKDMPDWQSGAEDEETLLIRIDTLKRFGPQTD